MAGVTRVPGLGPRTSLAEGASKLVAARMADVKRVCAVLSPELDTELVHDARVAVRRLRTALNLFDQQATVLQRRAKVFQDALGEVRDLQVEIGWLQSTDLKHQRRELVTARRRQLESHALALEDQLRKWQAVSRAPKLALNSLDGRLGGGAMRRALERRLRKVEQRFERLRVAHDPRSAHEARIAVKKLRYVAELLDPAFAAATTVLKPILVAAQGDLGDLHDGDVWSAHWAAEATRLDGPMRQAALDVARIADRHRRKALAAVRRDLARWIDEDVFSRVKSCLED
jgi:CHAD domain-containing protein